LTRFLAHTTTAILLLCVAGCASLPDTEALIARHSGQAARFDNAAGTVSVSRSAAIIAELKRKSGDIDILDKQIALEQATVSSPLVLGNKVTLLQDGTATYPAMLAAIHQARDHVNLESYIIEDDEVGRRFADLLLEKQSAGVQVNVIYDSVGSINTPSAFFERLRTAGVAVLEFNPVNPLAGKTSWLPNNRDHRKLLVVDGQVAFIGGINISSVYSSGSIIHRAKKAHNNPVPWRDTDLQIEGPVVAEFQKLFIKTWGKQRGEPLAARNYFPPLKTAGKDIVRAIGSSPDDPYSLIYLALISAIGNAERQVHLTNAYFVPDPRLIQSLIEAVHRGVDVQLVLPGHSDSGITFHAGRSHYSTLLEAGVIIHERQGALLHAKTAVIDGVWSCLGSSNLDWRSFLDNDEINAIVIGHEFAAQMQAMLRQDIRSSHTVDLATWQRRSPLLHLKEWGSRLLQRWL
jgi:cardiolipin synthase A/B